MKKEIFAEPTFQGERFKATLPIDALMELKAYADLVMAAAEYIYRKANDQGKRLPKGFKQKFKVDLTGIKSGSSLAVVERTYQDESDLGDEFDQARLMINQIIDGADSSTPSELPSSLRPLFLAFGKSLADNESISLKIPNESKRTVYTKQNRLRLLTSNQTKPTKGIFYGFGSISGFEVTKETFTFITEDNLSVIGHMDPTYNMAIRESAKDYENVSVQVYGLGVFKADKTLSEIEKVQHIILYKESEKPSFFPNVEARLGELASLKQGWFGDSKGNVISSTLIAFVKSTIDALLSDGDIPSPFLYPTPEGAVQAEWSFGMWEVSMLFDSDEKVVYLQAVKTDSEETHEDKFHFEDQSAVLKASSFIKKVLRIESV